MERYDSSSCACRICRDRQRSTGTRMVTTQVRCVRSRWWIRDRLYRSMFLMCSIHRMELNSYSVCMTDWTYPKCGTTKLIHRMASHNFIIYSLLLSSQLLAGLWQPTNNAHALKAAERKRLGYNDEQKICFFFQEFSTQIHILIHS